MAWAKLKTTVAVGLGILLAGVIAAPLIMQQQALAAARAEQSELQARLLNPAQTVRPTGQIPGAIDMAVRDRADLESLRVESVALQAKITEFSAQAQQLAAASSWHKPGGIPLGEVIRMRNAQDVGQTTPVATAQTLFWATLHGDTNRLDHLWVMDSGTDIGKAEQDLKKELEDIAALDLDDPDDHPSIFGSSGRWLLYTWLIELRASDAYFLEEQPGDNNDQWLVIAMVQGGEEEVKVTTGRLRFRPTDTGWSLVWGASEEPAMEPITDQP